MSKQTEMYYTVKDIARNWKLSTDTIQKMFLKAHYDGDTGILVIKTEGGRWKTIRHTLRISESAVNRMLQRLQTSKAA